MISKDFFVLYIFFLGLSSGIYDLQFGVGQKYSVSYALYSVKYAGIPVFSYPYFLAFYEGKYESGKPQDYDQKRKLFRTNSFVLIIY